MKLLSSITLALLTSTLTYAQTTMCFKENHTSMSTIESTKLDGGECNSKFTLNDMKNKGYKIDDIKISKNNEGNFNFIYILKNEDSYSNNFNTTLDEKELEKRIIAKMKIKEAEEKKEKEIKKNLNLIADGKKIYTNKCQSCHGEKGEKSAYNVATPLINLTEKEITYAINQYSIDSNYGNSYNIIMKAIANGTTKDDIKKIKAYLDSINK
ncbi:c-type cytochrome [Arcobacter sp. YIC-464]|uniref:c-type cytochrome n=1 Tax=Arcobacter sp. YIC-464 TaxID=3376631 RepID=UPI003C248BC5